MVCREHRIKRQDLTVASAPALASYVSSAKLLPHPGPLFPYLKIFDQIISRFFVPIPQLSMTFSCLFLVGTPQQ